MQVFIWDNNPLQARNLQHIFEGERHKIQLCKGYQDLREKIKPFMHTPAVLVINSNALRSLRQIYHLHRYAPYLSILTLCSQQDSLSHLSLLNAGADAYLSQPFTPEILLAQSRSLHRHSTRLLQAKLEQRNTLEVFGDFTFDFSQYTAHYKQTVLPLKKREFLLLHHLIKHAKSIHARQHLHPIIWPGKPYAHGRQIDNLILSLRKKLPENVVAIQSHYGEGYQLHLLTYKAHLAHHKSSVDLRGADAALNCHNTV